MDEGWDHQPVRCTCAPGLNRPCTFCMLQRGKEAAKREVRKHLDAGREVYGRRDGKPVVIKP